MNPRAPRRRDGQEGGQVAPDAAGTGTAAQSRARREEQRRRVTRARRRLLGAALVACAAIVILASSGGDGGTGDRTQGPLVAARPASPPPPRPAPVRRFSVGSGPTGAVVVRRADRRRRPAVIFLHGWELLQREAYRAWLVHLARQGASVIAPRYQLPNGTPPETVLANALAGVRAALRRFPVERDRVTLAGHSAGGVLAADYAAVAAQENLPPARGILAIYPGRAIRGTNGIPPADLTQIPAGTRLVVMVSAADRVVGEGPGRELLAGATQVPAERRALVSVRDRQAGDHYAPTRPSQAAQRVFWRALDRLIARP